MAIVPPASSDPLGARASLATSSGSVDFYRLDALERANLARLELIPMTVYILL